MMFVHLETLYNNVLKNYFVAEQRKNRNRLRKETLTKRSAEGAGEAMPKKVRKKQGDPENVSSHSIRTAFSLLQRKFDRHRDAATEKLAKLEKQLGQMRKQHAQRQRTCSTTLGHRLCVRERALPHPW